MTILSPETAAASSPSPGPDRRVSPTQRRVLWASLVGTSVEFYDFYLYATASALVFGPVFFADSTPQTAILKSFAAYGVGFAARPIGGIIAGHLGDRIGRARLLVYSLLLMGIASTAIGLLPGSATAGTWVVAALVGLRLVQGLASGAEWGGSALLSVEHARPTQRGLFGSVTQMGSAARMLLATGVFTLTRVWAGPEAFLEWAWRVPFLLSAVLVAIGLVIRLRVQDAPEFNRVRDSGAVHRFPVATVLRRHWRSVLITAGLRLVQPAVYSILTVYALSYLAAQRGDTTSALTAVLVVSALSLISTPFWGALSDRIGPRKIAIWSATGMIIGIWPYFHFLNVGPLYLLIPVTIIGMNILHDSIYGPQAGWFAQQFPVSARYSGISLGYQLGSVFSVGLTPLLAAWLFDVGGGTPWLICGYIGVLGLLSIWAAVTARQHIEN